MTNKDIVSKFAHKIIISESAANQTFNYSLPSLLVIPVFDKVVITCAAK